MKDMIELRFDIEREALRPISNKQWEALQEACDGECFDDAWIAVWALVTKMHGDILDENKR